MRRRLLLVLSCLAGSVFVLPVGVASARPAVGIGEQHATMFTSKSFKRLKLHDARYLTPWDTIEDGHQLAMMDTWMTAARRAHVRVLVGLGHSLRSYELAGRLPSARRFAADFKLLHARYPWVRDWLPWNEANSPGGLTEHRPAGAAQYYDVMVWACPGCRVAAADVLDSKGMPGWVKRFRRAVHHKPKIWGLHNYVDANRGRTSATRTFLKATGSGQVWFAETGGLVLRRAYVGPRPVKTYRYGVKRAAKATAQALRLGSLSRRVTRIYLYHWQAPTPVTSWDSGLLDGRGRPRAAYTVLRRWLHR